MGTEKWGYDPNIFDQVDTNKDGLLNSTELENYFTSLYPDESDQVKYQGVDNVLTNTDINGDGLISKGEIALYKSGKEYLDENIFKTNVNSDSATNQTQWDDLKKEYNIYDSKEIISRGEIMDHDRELYRKAMSFSSTTFNAADADKNGFLNHSELKTYLENIYGTCSQKQMDYTFSKLDVNKDNLISDGEFALFKLNNEHEITSDKLVNAGFSKSDADALVQKYAPKGRSWFSASNVREKDETQTNKSVDSANNGLNVGGLIAVIFCSLIVIGLIAWGIWWLNKDDKKEKETTITEIKEIESNVDTNLKTINGLGQQAGIE